MTAAMAKKRLEYLDTVKGVGIIGIVAMHSTLLSERAVYGISQMVTPLFFLASGMLIAHTGEEAKGGREIFKRKARSLMLPFFCFSLLYILRDLVRFFLGSCDMAEIWTGCRDLVTLYGSSVLWFLPTLFLAEILFFFLRRKVPEVWTYLICLFLTVVSYRINERILLRQLANLSSVSHSMPTLFVQSFLRAAYALPFLCFGYLIYGHFRDFWEEERVSPGQFCCGVLLLGAGIFLNVRYADLDFRGLYFGQNPILVYLLAPVPFAGLVLLGKNCRPLRVLTYFGKNSLTVMATHIGFYVLNLGLKATAWICSLLPGKAGDILRFLGTMAIVLLLEAACIETIDRFFPFLIGKGSSCKKKPGEKGR